MRISDIELCDSIHISINTALDAISTIEGNNEYEDFFQHRVKCDKTLNSIVAEVRYNFKFVKAEDEYTSILKINNNLVPYDSSNPFTVEELEMLNKYSIYFCFKASPNLADKLTPVKSCAKNFSYGYWVEDAEGNYVTGYHF